MHYKKNIKPKTEKQLINIEKKYADHFTRIGERFKKLRMDDCEYSIQNMENELGIKKGSLRRLENGEGASMFTFLNIIFYFVRKGYAIDWLLTYDNSNLFRKSKEIEFVTYDKEKLSKIAENSSNRIINEIYKLNNEIMNVLEIKNDFNRNKSNKEEEEPIISPDILEGYDDIAKYMEEIDLKEKTKK